MLDETITVNEQYDAALDTIIKLQGELKESKLREAETRESKNILSKWISELQEEIADLRRAVGDREQLKNKYQQERDQLAARLKTQEDALAEVRDHCYTPQDASRSRDIAKQALAAKEPKCNCGPNPDVHEDWCATKDYGISRNALRAIRGAK